MTTEDKRWWCPSCKERSSNFINFTSIGGAPRALCGSCNSEAKLIPHQLTVPELLRAAAETYEQRNKLYGDNYKRFGSVMLALLPGGVKLETEDDWNRFGVFFHLVGKLTRYAANINEGGHEDSAHDASVYAAMLEELTQEKEKG